MPSVTVQTTIARPVAEVFAFVADSANDPSWAPFVKSAEQIEGDGPGVGAVWRIGQLEGGRIGHNELTMTAHVPHTELAWAMSTDEYDYRSTMRLEDVDGASTRLTQTNTLDFRRPLAGRIWQAMAQLALRRQFQLLRRHLEA